MTGLKETKPYELDILCLAPQVASQKGELGRTAKSILKEVLNEYLNAEREHYEDLKNGRYILHIASINHDLGTFKVEVIGREIQRRINKAISNNEKKTASEPHSRISALRRAPLKKRRLPEKKFMVEEPPLDYLELVKQTEVVFRPIWNVSKNHLTGFIARHKCEGMNINKYVSDQLTIAAQCQADLGLLVLSTVELKKALDREQKVVIILPVSFDTLARQQFREQYLEFCRRIPAKIRDLMVLHIKKIPANAQKERLQEVQRDISELVRSVIITSDLRNQNFDRLLGQHIHAGIVSLEDAPEKEIHNISLMESFVEKMSALSRAAMVDGISSKSMLCAALGAGFSYISGPAVQPDQKNMAAMRPFGLQSIYGY